MPEKQLGVQMLAMNLSFAATVKRQGIDPLTFFKTILLNGKENPITELYNSDTLPKNNMSCASQNQLTGYFFLVFLFFNPSFVVVLIAWILKTHKDYSCNSMSVE